MTISVYVFVVVSQRGVFSCETHATNDVAGHAHLLLNSIPISHWVVVRSRTGNLWKRQLGHRRRQQVTRTAKVKGIKHPVSGMSFWQHEHAGMVVRISCWLHFSGLRIVEG